MGVFLIFFSCVKKDESDIISKSKWEYIEFVGEVKKTHILSFGEHSFIYSIYTEIQDSDPEIIEIGGRYVNTYNEVSLESFGEENLYVLSSDKETLQNKDAPGIVFKKKKENR